MVADLSGLGMADRLNHLPCLVLKIGSALLVEEATGAIRQDWLRALAADVARLQAAGHRVVLVSSGAIAAGRKPLGLMGRRLKLPEKQAAAATGQILLAHAYQAALAAHGISVAQILLTLEDTERRRRHLNARATLDTLLGLGVVPVVNENDTVATTEIRFGDNDRLAARVAQMVSANLLVLLSDIDGLYTADPRHDPTAEHLPDVHALTPDILALAGDAASTVGTGGMVTKLEAARIALDAGCHMVICQGRALAPLSALLAGARHTWFHSRAEPRQARKQWIASHLETAGHLVVDAGAARALGAGRSLLAAGVVEVKGGFEKGDVVAVRGPDGADLGRGLVAYDASVAVAIAGQTSEAIEAILGWADRPEIIHRDDLVLFHQVPPLEASPPPNPEVLPP